MTKLAQIIAQEIAAHGVIPFDRFMDLALYCPVYGYYEMEEDTIGARGDFYTSVSVGPLFGEMLAFQFAEWLEKKVQGQKSEVRSPKSEVQGAESSSKTDTESRTRTRRMGVSSEVVSSRAGEGDGAVQIVEAGAHRGQLAGDILRWMAAHRPEIFERLEYRIIEPSDRRRQWQQQTLAEFQGHVHWIRNLSELAGPAAAQPSTLDPRLSDVIPRIIFSNELLDAMPVRRFGWDARQRAWFEWGVTLNREQFVWAKMEPENALPADVSSVACEGLNKEADSSTRNTQHATRNTPHAFTLESCPAAEAWWHAAASTLTCGKLLTIDYGLTEEEFLMPQRKDGTLRAYRRHHPCSDPLADPGEQDLTAHVNFTHIQAAGEAAGLETEAFLTQPQFLTGIAARIWQDESAFGPWTPARTRQFQTLTHPEHLGHAFRVLVQSRKAN